jgi:RNA-directed DNA polymerase
MDWDNYKARFEQEAISQGRSAQFVRRWLAYAEPLARRGVPVIYSFVHLGALLGFESDALLAAAQAPDTLYFSYRLPKRKGGYREISQPRESLRAIQSWVLTEILDRCAPHEAATGFCHGKSIKNNALAHAGHPMILSLDLREFFPSVRASMVEAVFQEVGYTEEVAQGLTRLTTLRGGLPQGAPTSPALSNLVMRGLDAKLSLHARRNRLVYTRYADDITFSGRFRPGNLIWRTRRIVSEFGFTLNESKTRLMLPHERQEITGVVVNKHLQAPRNVRRGIRQELHYIGLFGIEEHQARKGSLYGNRLDHLRGLAEFVRFLNPTDRDALRARDVLGPARFGKPAP